MGEDERVKVLGMLSEYLSEAERAVVLADALTIARKIDSDFDKPKALLNLTPYLPETDRPAVLLEVLSIAKTIAKEDFRQEILAMSAEHLEPLSIITLYPLWCQTLHVLASCSRRELLRGVRALTPIIAALGGLSNE